jgi:hypothetical protein
MESRWAIETHAKRLRVQGRRAGDDRVRPTGKIEADPLSRGDSYGTVDRL